MDILKRLGYRLSGLIPSHFLRQTLGGILILTSIGVIFSDTRTCLLHSAIHYFTNSKPYDCTTPTASISPWLGLCIMILGLLVFLVNSIFRKRVSDYRIDPEERLLSPEVKPQTAFSYAQYDDSKTKTLADFETHLVEYMNQHLDETFTSREFISGQQQTIFSIANTRFSTFLAVVSDNGDILMFHRPTSKNKTNNKNDKYDFFGSVGYENLSIQQKLFSNPQYKQLETRDIIHLPGIAIEQINHKSQKIEIAVMIGHLAIIKQNSFDDLKTIALSDDLFIFDKNNYPSNITAKAKLAIEYIQNNI